MSLPRFYLPPPRWNPEALALEDEEAKHCVQVLRKGVGDEIMVFNGRGAWAKAALTSASSKKVELQCFETGETAAPPVSITLLQAIPKGSNMDLIVEKAVELGVNAIVPVMTERTVVQIDAKEAPKKQAKWQRIALEACKQCGQNWLPEVHPPLTFEKAWGRLPEHDLRLVAAILPDSQSLKSTLRSSPASVLMLIGPEGDLTPTEYATARTHRCLPISLGPIILRVETAAMYCLSVLNHELRQT